ncbi:N-acetylglucosamine kinase [Paenibacillus selenitireducens]|uniref:N-acetylglucosamine kinase n=1 Tax=Paenibacillus selenitireducens TaxID=1324314 RepID=UPI0009964466
MLRYVAGLDGGGTKTAVSIADETGRIVHTFRSGALNFNGQDEESIGNSLQSIFAEIARVCGSIDHCVQVCVGTAGVSNPTVRLRLEAMVRATGYQHGLWITGDQETALWGAHGRPYGIILIAGTGSICYGKNDSGLTHRAGGCGYLIDDEGSGYSIGRDLISALVRAQDGRLPETLITRLVYEQLGVSSLQQIIGFVYDKGTNKKDIAALAPILSDACLQGDTAALHIASKSAQSLLELAEPVVEQLMMQQASLAMAGSVLLENTYVQRAFVDMLKQRYPKLNCITPQNDASTGAVLMALDQLQ